MDAGGVAGGLARFRHGALRHRDTVAGGEFARCGRSGSGGGLAGLSGHLPVLRHQRHGAPAVPVEGRGADRTVAAPDGDGGRMRAVILAAGRGGRLRGIVGDRPQGLAVVGGWSLIERQIRALRECGIARIAVVAGFGAPDVGRVCDPTIDIVQNVHFASTNSLYSLWLTRGLLADGFVVLNCDVLFHPQLLADLLTSRYDDALLMCPRSNGTEYSDEEMKVRVRRGLVTAIDKALPPAHADGENVGIAKFGAAGAALLVDEMTAIVRSDG